MKGRLEGPVKRAWQLSDGSYSNTSRKSFRLPWITINAKEFPTLDPP